MEMAHMWQGMSLYDIHHDYLKACKDLSPLSKQEGESWAEHEERMAYILPKYEGTSYFTTVFNAVLRVYDPDRPELAEGGNKFFKFVELEEAAKSALRAAYIYKHKDEILTECKQYIANVLRSEGYVVNEVYFYRDVFKLLKGEYKAKQVIAVSADIQDWNLAKTLRSVMDAKDAKNFRRLMTCYASVTIRVNTRYNDRHAMAIDKETGYGDGMYISQSRLSTLLDKVTDAVYNNVSKLRDDLGEEVKSILQQKTSDEIVSAAIESEGILFNEDGTVNIIQEWAERVRVAIAEKKVSDNIEADLKELYKNQPLGGAC